MVDFFSNLNSKIVQPILGNVAEKAGELQDNGEVDLPVLQNIAGQLGISEEKYEKIEDGLFGLAEGVLSAAAPIIDKVAPVADQVFDMLLQSLGNGKFTAVSSTANAQNNAEPATAEAQVEEEPETIQQPAQQPVNEQPKDPVGNIPQQYKDAAAEIHAAMQDYGYLGDVDRYQLIDQKGYSSEELVYIMKAYSAEYGDTLINAMFEESPRERRTIEQKKLYQQQFANALVEVAKNGTDEDRAFLSAEMQAAQANGDTVFYNICKAYFDSVA